LAKNDPGSNQVFLSAAMRQVQSRTSVGKRILSHLWVWCDEWVFGQVFRLLVPKQ